MKEDGGVRGSIEWEGDKVISREMTSGTFLETKKRLWYWRTRIEAEQIDNLLRLIYSTECTLCSVFKTYIIIVSSSGCFWYSFCSFKIIFLFGIQLLKICRHLSALCTMSITSDDLYTKMRYFVFAKKKVKKSEKGRFLRLNSGMRSTYVRFPNSLPISVTFFKDLLFYFII